MPGMKGTEMKCARKPGDSFVTMEPQQQIAFTCATAGRKKKKEKKKKEKKKRPKKRKKERTPEEKRSNETAQSQQPCVGLVCGRKHTSLARRPRNPLLQELGVNAPGVNSFKKNQVLMKL